MHFPLVPTPFTLVNTLQVTLTIALAVSPNMIHRKTCVLPINCLTHHITQPLFFEDVNSIIELYVHLLAHKEWPS
jgi:hypothetical protein